MVLASLIPLLGLTVSQDASAAKKAKGPEVAIVGVHIDGLDEPGSLELAEALADALAAGAMTAVPPETVHGRLEGRQPLVVQGAAFGPGRRKRDEGRILYDRADFEGAIPVLQEAVEALESGMSGTGDPRELVAALLLLGQAQWSIGETLAAEEAFSGVVVLDPARQLDPVNYPPKIVSFFNDVRYATLSKTKGKVQLQVPDRNRVLIDGREVLSGTVELIPGTHYVLVTGPDGERDFRVLEVQSAQTEVLQSRPQERSLGVAAASRAERAQQIRLLYSALGIHAGTQLVLLGGEVDGGNVALQLFEARTSSFSNAAVAPAGGDPAAALLGLVPDVLENVSDSGNLRTDRIAFDVAALAQDDNPLLAALLLDPDPFSEPAQPARTTNWAVWAGVGAIAAGGAAAAIVTLSTASSGDEPAPGPVATEDVNEGVILIGPLPE